MIEKESISQNINDYILKERKIISKEIGEKIKEKRREKNFTLLDFALKTNTSATYISQIEKGEYNMSLLKFIFFCNILEINAAEVLEDFIYTDKNKEDLLLKKLQENKNISNNILEFMKEK